MLDNDVFSTFNTFTIVEADKNPSLGNLFENGKKFVHQTDSSAAVAHLCWTWTDHRRWREQVGGDMVRQPLATVCLPA